MDRLKTLVLGGGLGLILVAPGCRSPKSEVPLGRAAVKDASAMPQVQFSSEPAQQQAPPSMSNGSGTVSGLGAPPTVTIPGVPPAVPNAGPAPTLTMPSTGAVNSRMQMPSRPNFGPGAAPGSDLPDLSAPATPH